MKTILIDELSPNKYKSIYVSVDGDDNNADIAIDNYNYPLKTLDKAFEIANTIDISYFVYIILKDGTYYLSSTLSISNIRSGIQVKSENDRNAYIKGCTLIDNSVIETYSESIIRFPVNDDIFSISVESDFSDTDVRYLTKNIDTSTPFSMKDTGYWDNYQNGEYLLIGSDIYEPIQLFLNVDSSELDLTTITYPDSYSILETSGTYQYTVTDGNGNSASSLSGMENIHLEWARSVKTHYMKIEVSESIYDIAYSGCYISIYNAWYQHKLKVYSKYEDNGTYYIIIYNGRMGQIHENVTYYISVWNRIEDLSAGKYCIVEEDSVKYCYYNLLDGENIDNIEIGVSYINKIMNIFDCVGITFKNICIGYAAPKCITRNFGQTQHSSEGKIVIYNSQYITFDGCLFEGTYDYTIQITDESKRCSITNSLFKNLYGGAILGDGDSYYCNIKNNIIKSFGRQEEDVAGILLCKCHKYKIMHNDILDGFYSGICTGWGWSLDLAYSTNLYIAYNHIHHLFQGLLTDGAGIYNLGDTAGMIIEYNKIHDIIGHSITYSAGCIYHDAGSSKSIIRYNILYAASNLISTSGRWHYIYNNIFAYPINSITNYVSSMEYINAFYRNNIFYRDVGDLVKSYDSNSPVGLMSNLEIYFENTIDNLKGEIRNNNFSTMINPFNDSLNGDFKISQITAASIYEDCGFICSNKNTNGHINDYNFEAWWRRDSNTIGVLETMWAVSEKDMLETEITRLKNMYITQFGSEIGEYWNN